MSSAHSLSPAWPSPCELVLILVRGETADAAAVGTASGVFGLGVLLADVGLIGLGVLAVRQRRWPRAWAYLPLALGMFQLAVVTPVSMAAGFTSIASNVAIGVADLMTAAIGCRLLSAGSLQNSRSETRSNAAQPIGQPHS